MITQAARTGLQLRSLARRTGELELSLVSIPVPDPLPDEVLVRVEATPRSTPPDLGLLFGRGRHDDRDLFGHCEPSGGDRHDSPCEDAGRRRPA